MDCPLWIGNEWRREKGKLACKNNFNIPSHVSPSFFGYLTEKERVILYASSFSLNYSVHSSWISIDLRNGQVFEIRDEKIDESVICPSFFGYVSSFDVRQVNSRSSLPLKIKNFPAFSSPPPSSPSLLPFSYDSQISSLQYDNYHMYHPAWDGKMASTSRKVSSFTDRVVPVF